MLLLVAVTTFLAAVCTNQIAASAIFSVARLPEEFMNLTQIIAYQGYQHEIHDVRTQDGYILTVVRIPHGRKRQASKGPVFLQHGLLDSGHTWLMNNAEESLGFVLADAGYDVWIGNSRGNTYSRKHAHYTTDDAKFWDFSFDEMAKYDVPACIDYVLAATGHAQLYYAGHSQGTLTGFIAFAQRPDISKKVRKFFALAPVAKVKNIKGAFKIFANFDSELEFFFKMFGVKEFLPQTNWMLDMISDLVCTTAKSLCSNFIFMLAGSDVKNFNATRIPVMSAHTPAGTSVKNIVHFSQLVSSGKYAMYDYGKEGNIKHYKQATAPSYDLRKVATPTVLYSGGHDWLADPLDVAYLSPLLPNVVAARNISHYNHLDFVWGVSATKLVYTHMIAEMEEGDAVLA